MGVQALNDSADGVFVMPLVVDASQMSDHQYALYLAVMHHGFASMSRRGMPASKDTVAATADFFLAYLGR